MTYLIDTNAFIHLVKLHEPLASRVHAVGHGSIAVSAITLAELWYGAAKSQRPRRSRDEQDAALAPFRVLDFDGAAADQWAAVRAHLHSKGKPIGDRDLMIASLALANHMTIVTSNVTEFSRVPRLHVEDWMKPQRA